MGQLREVAKSKARGQWFLLPEQLFTSHTTLHTPLSSSHLVLLSEFDPQALTSLFPSHFLCVVSDSAEQTTSRLPTEEFVQLFTKAQRPLYLFILAQTGNVQSAEEILQETNLVIWAKMDQFRPQTSFSSWTRQIATYEILKHRQRFRRDKLTFSDEFLTAVAGEMDVQTSELELRREALQKCLEKLGSKDRELIQQRYHPGTNGKELARKRGRPLNSVYQSLGRIRRSLLECIHRQLATESS